MNPWLFLLLPQLKQIIKSKYLHLKKRNLKQQELFQLPQFLLVKTLTLKLIFLQSSLFKYTNHPNRCVLLYNQTWCRCVICLVVFLHVKITFLCTQMVHNTLYKIKIVRCTSTISLTTIMELNKQHKTKGLHTLLIDNQSDVFLVKIALHKFVNSNHIVVHTINLIIVFVHHIIDLQLHLHT